MNMKQLYEKWVCRIMEEGDCMLIYTKVRILESVQAQVTQTLRTIADDWSRSGHPQGKEE